MHGTLADDALTQLEQQLLHIPEQGIIEQGYRTFRGKKVRTLEVMNERRLIGTVLGSTMYAVTVQADDLARCTCTCQHEVTCKHIVALYFGYISYAGLSLKETYDRLQSQPSLPLQIEEQATVIDKKMIPPATTWLDTMEAEHGDVWRTCKHTLHPLQTMLTTIKSQAKDWPPTMQKLYWMFAIVFAAEQAERAYAGTETYIRYYYELPFSRMTEPWLVQYGEWMQELALSSFSAEERLAFKQLGAFFHLHNVNREVQLHRWETLYFAYLAKLIDDEQWLQQEEATITDVLRRMPTQGSSYQFYEMSLAYVGFLRQQDEQAIERLRKVPFVDIALLASDCAFVRLNEGHWEQLERWLLFIFDHVKSGLKSKAQGPFFSMCRLAAERNEHNPLWEQLLVDCLPYSYRALSEHWFEHGHLIEWADLQLLLGFKPEELDAQVIRQVSKRSPEALMPIYHHAIDGAVRSRNRQGYRHAVKQMKKLEKLYQAADKLEAWGRYIQDISTKYQRLRAFQEELWKGKWLT